MKAQDDCAVQVAVRVRDLVPRERLEGFFNCVHVHESSAVVGGERSFGFDFAFGSDSTQKSIYDTAVKPLIESALSGTNVTVLAYGTALRFLVQRCVDLNSLFPHIMLATSTSDSSKQPARNRI
jgi:hypothetical protein